MDYEVSELALHYKKSQDKFLSTVKRETKNYQHQNSCNKVSKNQMKNDQKFRALSISFVPQLVQLVLASQISFNLSSSHTYYNVVNNSSLTVYISSEVKNGMASRELVFDFHEKHEIFEMLS